MDNRSEKILFYFASKDENSYRNAIDIASDSSYDAHNLFFLDHDLIHQFDFFEDNSNPTSYQKINPTLVKHLEVNQYSTLAPSTNDQKKPIFIPLNSLSSKGKPNDIWKMLFNVLAYLWQLAENKKIAEPESFYLIIDRDIDNAIARKIYAEFENEFNLINPQAEDKYQQFIKAQMDKNLLENFFLDLRRFILAKKIDLQNEENKYKWEISYSRYGWCQHLCNLIPKNISLHFIFADPGQLPNLNDLHLKSTLVLAGRGKFDRENHLQGNFAVKTSAELFAQRLNENISENLFFDEEKLKIEIAFYKREVLSEANTPQGQLKTDEQRRLENKLYACLQKENKPFSTNQKKLADTFEAARHFITLKLDPNASKKEREDIFNEKKNHLLAQPDKYPVFLKTKIGKILGKIAGIISVGCGIALTSIAPPVGIGLILGGLTLFGVTLSKKKPNVEKIKETIHKIAKKTNGLFLGLGFSFLDFGTELADLYMIFC